MQREAETCAKWVRHLPGLYMPANRSHVCPDEQVWDKIGHKEERLEKED